MPFYEFYCRDCHTRFRFFSRRVNTDKRPACPKCARPEIDRQISLFAISKGRREDEAGMPDLDESQLEQAFASMSGELERLDENDPRAAAQVMRRLFHAGGMHLGAAMEEALGRMEAGEDAEQIEAELGDELSAEEALGQAGGIRLNDVRRRLLPPHQDPEIYEL